MHPRVGLLQPRVHSVKLALIRTELIALPQNEFSQLYPVFRKIFHEGELRQLLGKHQVNESTLIPIFDEEQLTRIANLPLYSQVSVGEIGTYTQNVLLRDTDQMSMAHSLEVRVPFFDHTLVEYVLAIPDKHKEPSYPKKLLVDAMGDLLPHALVHRKKMGFVFPWDNWIRTDLRETCGQALDYLENTGLFLAGTVNQLWERFQAKDKEIHWIKIWMLVILSDWIRRNAIKV
ncbi:MAG: asparagine synthase-related protein [Bacteroidota bacterium]